MTEAVVPAVERPMRADARRNFDALLVAARAAFAEHGAGAALDDIARRAAVSIATLYRHFPTRESLIETVYVDEIASLAEVAEQALDLGPWEGLRLWLDRFCEYIGTKHALIDGINRDGQLFKKCLDSLFAGGQPLLSRAQAANLVRKELTIDDVIRLIGAVAAVRYNDDSQRDRILDLAIDGLRASH